MEKRKARGSEDSPRRYGAKELLRDEQDIVIAGQYTLAQLLNLPVCPIEISLNRVEPGNTAPMTREISIQMPETVCNCREQDAPDNLKDGYAFHWTTPSHSDAAYWRGIGRLRRR
jgi:hypothetical protein